MKEPQEFPYIVPVDLFLCGIVDDRRDFAEIVNNLRMNESFCFNPSDEFVSRSSRTSAIQ